MAMKMLARWTTEIIQISSVLIMIKMMPTQKMFAIVHINVYACMFVHSISTYIECASEMAFSGNLKKKSTSYLDICFLPVSVFVFIKTVNLNHYFSNIIQSLDKTIEIRWKV